LHRVGQKAMIKGKNIANNSSIVNGALSTTLS
jgi:hypothetical protein